MIVHSHAETEKQITAWRDEAFRRSNENVDLKAINAQLLEVLEIIATGKGVSKSALYLLNAAGQNGARWNDAQNRARNAIKAATEMED